MPDPMPSPQLLEELSRFFRLLSEPARLQLLCLLVQHRLRQRLESQLQTLGGR